MILLHILLSISLLNKNGTKYSYAQPSNFIQGSSLPELLISKSFPSFSDEVGVTSVYKKVDILNKYKNPSNLTFLKITLQSLYR